MNEYYKKIEIENTEKLKGILVTLPIFCFSFFTGIQNTTSTLTRLNYAYDLRLFFEYLTTECETFRGLKYNSFGVTSLEKVTVDDIENFLSHISCYTSSEGKTLFNNETGKARKLASIRSFFKYYFNKGQLDANISAKVQMPKIHDKEIIRLEVDEVVKILDAVENGDQLQGRAKSFNKHTKLRDLAILTLFLGTGIRVSELVGLDITDVDFDTCSFIVTRKGGNRTILYFSEEVSNALRKYIDERKSLELVDNNIKDANALFLSLQKSRLSIRAVQNLVQKYSAIASPLKKISPHKLRSTYGTNLYRETQDIYVVADILGHKDINTTKKHYAAISDDIRRNAANKVQLRDKETNNND